MITVRTERDATYTVNVDGHGWIVLDHHGHHGERRLSHAEAAALADSLLEGIRLSQDRNQMNRSSYYDTEEIQRRRESPIGQAQTAIRKIFR